MQTTPLEIFSSSPGLLSCINCYAYITVSLVINIQMCFEMGYLSGFSYT